MKNATSIRNFATLIAAVDFVVSIPLWFAFDRQGELFQFRESATWIEAIGARYEFGIDGIALLLVLLTTFLGVLAFLSSWTAIDTREKEYYIFLLLLQTGMMGVFMAMDFFLFYVFWEVMLVPMYFLIGIWGGPAQALCSHQVLSLHPGGLGADVARDPGALLLQQHWALWLGGAGESEVVLYPTVPRYLGCDSARSAVLGLCRLLYRLCHQGSHVPVSHLVAGCSCGGTHRGFGDPGGCPLENGHLRLCALFLADPA